MKLIPNAASRKLAGQVLLAKKNSPTILFGAGIAGSVASTVLACRATLRLEEVLREAQHDLVVAKEIDAPGYSEGDRRSDITLIYARSVGKLVRLYGPSVMLGAASVGCLTKSHNLLQERNLALTAAYAAVDEAFNKYRARVIEKYGEDEDRLFRYEGETIKIVDDETGKTVSEIRAAESNDGSMYARFFDEYSTSWSKEPEYNLVFLRNQQNWANDLLKTRGHLFLNEVYDMLGIPRSRAGSVVGWVIGDGDNFVDFGIYDSKDRVRDFVNGREGSILLDFNVDGVIWDKIVDNGERLRWQS